MNITIDKAAIIQHFLNPISRVADECTLHLTNNSIYSLVNDMAGNIFLYCHLTTQTNLIEDFRLNIKDIKKLVRVFECIQPAIIDLNIDQNASVMKYKSPELSFKLHLVTEDVIHKCQISLEKIKQLTFDSTFTMTGTTLTEILKGSTFTPETNKIYIFEKDKQIYAELTDHNTADTDSITFIVSNTLSGDPISTPIPFTIDILRILSAHKPDIINVKINNTYKLIEFEIKTDISLNQYLIPAYVK